MAKKSESKALDKISKSHSVAKPFDYEEEMAKLAKEAKESEPLPAGLFVSLKGGLFIGDNRMKDDKVDVVILGYLCENTFYATKYNPEETQAPSCYALGAREEDLTPADNAAGYWDPESETFTKPEACEACPMNEWASADTGKGKACQNRRRLGFISANGIEEGADYIKTAEVVQMKLPVTSVKAWRSYVHSVASLGAHPAFIVTTIERTEDDDTMFKVSFNPGARLDPELAEAIMARREEVLKLLETPYEAVDVEELKELITNPPRKGKREGGGKAGKGRGRF